MSIKSYIMTAAMATALAGTLATGAASAQTAEGEASTQHARTCVSSGAGAFLIWMLPGILTLPVDGGLLFVASLPVAAKAGTFSCIGAVAGEVAAEEIIGD